jgi:hypothetical protein
MRLSGGAGVETAAAGASHSLNRQTSRILWRGAGRVMLDKVVGDMIHLGPDLRRSKEDAAYGTIISSHT